MHLEKEMQHALIHNSGFAHIQVRTQQKPHVQITYERGSVRRMAVSRQAVAQTVTFVMKISTSFACVRCACSACEATRIAGCGECE
jgi:hypothetical protein